MAKHVAWWAEASGWRWSFAFGVQTKDLIHSSSIFLHEGFGDLDYEDESDDNGDDDESDDDEDEEHGDACEGPVGCEEDGEGGEEPDDKNDYWLMTMGLM